MFVNFFNLQNLKACRKELFLGSILGIIVALILFLLFRSSNVPQKIKSPVADYPRRSYNNLLLSPPSSFLDTPSKMAGHSSILTLLAPTKIPVSTPMPSIAPTPVPVKTNQSVVAQGVASYYSSSGCMGCNSAEIMANGQPLNDSAYTLAENELPLGTSVVVENVATGAAVRATVTDRGGFEPLGRIADLTVATRDAIGCSSLCEIRIML